MQRRIHITGASGSGTTTLGRHLAKELGCPHFDTDDFYWVPTEPPFRVKREIPERLRLLTESLSAESWVLSGCIGGWGAPLIPLFTLVIYLSTPVETRLARLRQRERLRFGPAIDPGGERNREHEDFLEWAAAYDLGNREGRSRIRHRAWLDLLPCPVIELNGDRPTDDLALELRRRFWP